jgi:hypothetical protein
VTLRCHPHPACTQPQILNNQKVQLPLRHAPIATNLKKQPIRMVANKTSSIHISRIQGWFTAKKSNMYMEFVLVQDLISLK